MKVAYIVIIGIVGMLLLAQAYAIPFGNIARQAMEKVTGHVKEETQHNVEINRTENETKMTVKVKTPGVWMKLEHFIQFKHKAKVAVETKEQFQLKLQKWNEAKQQCEAGNCTMYLNATKEMVISGIDATIARLETVNSTESQEIIANLTEYRAQVENATDISELREIYPEIRQEIAEANKLFAKHMLIHLAYTYMDYLDEKPQTEQSLEIKNQINALIQNATNATPSELAHQLKIIRVQIMALG